MIKKIAFTLIGFICYSHAFPQQSNEITFTIETLQRPANLLPEQESQDVILKFAPKQLAHSQMPEKIVDALAHPFFDGMYMAYADHRPFVISPDMIWLLICQGFSHHVNNNAETLRNMFVNFEGKKSLIVQIGKDQSLNSLSTWENVIPQFVQQVSDNTSKELIANLTPTFTTTTSTEKIATQITALESMRPYFEYIVIRAMCGIPEITIKGTSKDWQLLKERTDSLRKYKLDWWIDELDPLLDQFINASNGKFKKQFWRNMFKYHTEKKYGAPKVIDGWIIKFYPYDKKGKRNDFKMLRSSENLPDEQAIVDFKRIDVTQSGQSKTHNMQFMAGFFGLKQDKKTQALEPLIGWLVTAPSKSDNEHERDIKENSKSSFGLRIMVSEIPEAILKLKSIKFLSVDFIDSIKIPSELALVKIGRLEINGKINEDETKKVQFLFPKTKIKINNLILNKYEENDNN